MSIKGIVRNTIRDLSSKSAVKQINDNFQAIWNIMSKCALDNEFKYTESEGYCTAVMGSVKMYSGTITIPANTTSTLYLPVDFFKKVGYPTVSLHVPNGEYLNYSQSGTTLKDWSKDAIVISNWDASKQAKVNVTVFGS